MYYFAYSSNMNLEHMRRLCGWRFNVMGQAVLNDYEVGPDLRGYFNIRKKMGAKVMGVLYKLDEDCLKALDDIEGFPEVFSRAEILVNDIAGHAVKAWVYIQSPEKFGGDYIKENFLKMVIAGAEGNRLPQQWIKFLQSFCHPKQPVKN